MTRNISTKQFTEQFNRFVVTWNMLTSNFKKKRMPTVRDTMRFYAKLISELMIINNLMAHYIVQHASDGSVKLNICDVIEDVSLEDIFDIRFETETEQKKREDKPKRKRRGNNNA